MTHQRPSVAAWRASACRPNTFCSQAIADERNRRADVLRGDVDGVVGYH